MLLREQGVKQPVQPHIFGKISAPKQGSGTYCLSEGRIAFPHPACTLGQSCHPLISQQPVALLCFQHFSRFAGRQGAGRPMSACALNESFQQGWACVAQAQRHTLPWGQQLKRHHGLLQETCISFCNQSSFFFLQPLVWAGETSQCHHVPFHPLDDSTAGQVLRAGSHSNNKMLTSAFGNDVPLIFRRE